MLNYAISVYKRTNANLRSQKVNFHSGMPFDIFYRDLRYVELTGDIGDVEEITDVFDFIEKDNKVSLILKRLKAEHLSETNINFFTTEKASVSYDKITKTYEGNTDDIKFGQNIDLISLQNIFRYINELASVNQTVFGYVSKVSRKLLTISNLTYARSYGGIVLTNLLSLLQNNVLEVEKLINSNNEKVLTKNLSTEGFKLIPAKKLGKTIGLPPFTMPLIKKIRIESCVDSLNKLNDLVDGNDLRILLELFEDSRNFLIISKTGGDAKARENKVREFIDNLVFLMSPERKNKYKLQDVLNYVLRQSMYWSLSETFDFPFEEMKLFVDYISICEQHDLICDKYPQSIRRMHDVVLINVSALDDIKEEDFKNAVAKYKMYEMEIKDGYSFIIPESIHELIQEGNDLHHCIGSYAGKIAKEQAIIMFMRKTTEKDVSFVTIEIDKKCDIIEIKGIFNEEPEKDIIKIANKWAGICKRLSGK